MKCLLTSIRVSPGGGESRRQQEIEADVVTIGRGTDQHIHVPDAHVALDHARLLPAGPGRFRLEVLSRNGVVVNGRRQQDCRLSVGDVLELGDSTITIESPPPEFDLELAVRRTAAVGDEGGAFDGRTLHRGAPAIRILSWLMFLLVLGIGLVDPLISHFAPEKRASVSVLSLPGPKFWLSGPMSSPHKYFGHDCTTCHQQPFRPVANDSCTSCHENVLHHLPDGAENIADPAAQGCERCHQEHGGAEELVMRSQGFCADCHQDTSSFTGHPPVTGASTDFGREHPPFRVSVARLVAGGMEHVRLPLADAQNAEASNLKFPHDVHMDPEGVKSPESDLVMQCVDCHRAEPGGGLMAPVVFETHCNACHRLDFDLSAPSREVPHGDPQAALDILVDFYAQLALRGSSEEVPIEVLDSGDPQQALEWARGEARRAAADLFEDRACMQCHEIGRQAAGDTITWTVQPIYLHQSWLPAARFDHGSHETAECQDCHKASRSGESNDILLPDIDTCRECHGGDRAVDAVASTCISCHRFHKPQRAHIEWTGAARNGTLQLKAMPDLEARGREMRGIDPRRKRPGDEP